MEPRTFTVPAEKAGQRLDKTLAELAGLSRSAVQGLCEGGSVLVNGDPAGKKLVLREGDLVELSLPDPVELEVLPQEIPLDIVYEDDWLLVVNKPKGMVVHPAAGHYSGTLVNGLMYHCKDQLSGINGVMRPGIVHRIDMDTTGVLAVCKNDASHNCLAAQLKEHSITRVYFAVAHGVIKENSGTVRAPIGRHPTDRKRMSIHSKSGRDAVTHFEVLERFRHFTYVKCRLETGRTHQIRVHMASIGHPLLGDAVYGPAKQPFSLQGQTLHAGVLGFIHPRTGEYMEFSAPMPAYFEELLSKLRNGGGGV